MLKKVLVCCSLFILVSFCSVLNASVFSKMPETHWAWDSVQSLMDKGIVDKNTFKGFAGDRKMTRYEFAITFARFLGQFEQQMKSGSLLANKEELGLITKLNEEFLSELALLGMRNRVTENEMRTLKNDISLLQKDLKDVDMKLLEQTEKVKLSGNWLFRTTWKTHRNDWAINPYTGVAQPGNSNNHLAETQFRLRFDAQIDENISMGARFRLTAHASDSVYGAQSNRSSAFGLNGIGNLSVMDGFADTAFLKIKKLFHDKDELFLGRAGYWNGHGMLLNAFLDAIRYKRVLKNNVVVTAQHIYDRHIGNYKDDGRVDSRGIWNLYAEKKCSNRTHYLGLYAQDEPNLANDLFPATPATLVAPATPAIFALGNTLAGSQKHDSRRDIEFGSMGKIGRSNKFAYDLGFVYSDYKADIVSTALVPNIIDVRHQGWQGVTALHYKANNQFKAKIAYAFGDDESAGTYGSSNDARYVYSHETPWEDISRGNSYFSRGLRNMRDLKFQVEYVPANADKHYFRLIGDWINELDDVVQNDIGHHLAGNPTGVIPVGYAMPNSKYDTYNNIGIADPAATMLQFEYQYKFRKNITFRVGYVHCDFTGDAVKATATTAAIAAGRGFNKDYDYDLCWTDIYCTF